MFILYPSIYQRWMQYIVLRTKSLIASIRTFHVSLARYDSHYLGIR